MPALRHRYGILQLDISSALMPSTAQISHPTSQSDWLLPNIHSPLEIHDFMAIPYVTLCIKGLPTFQHFSSSSQSL